MDERLTHWEGEPLRVWEELWGIPHFEAWSRIGSTNDRVRALADAGGTAFSAVVAEEQTAGRGRSGKRWESPPGLGLWISVLIRPAAAEAQRLVPLLAGVAAARAFEREAPEARASLKWPNDVLFGSRKAAGILCEAAAGGSVIAGIGVNVRHRLEDFPAELEGRATSLEIEAGRPLSRGRIAGTLLGELKMLLSRAPLRLEGTVAEEIARRDALVGSQVAVEGGPRGTARGVDALGRLRVQIAPGRVALVTAGTVRQMT